MLILPEKMAAQNCNPSDEQNSPQMARDAYSLLFQRYDRPFFST